MLSFLNLFSESRVEELAFLGNTAVEESLHVLAVGMQDARGPLRPF